MSNPTIPTNEELQAAAIEARKALHDVRVSVAEGTANADDLASAERNANFAETRLNAAHEARQAKIRKADQQRVTEILEELKAAEPLMNEARALEESIRELVEKLAIKTSEVRGEVAEVYYELDRIRERNRDLIAGAGIVVSHATTAIRVGDTTYVAREVDRILTDLGTAVANNRYKRPAAQRPPRQKKAA